MMNFSTLTSLQAASDGQRWGKGVYNNADSCYYTVGTGNSESANCKTTPGFASLNQQEWKVKYNSGTTKGTLYGSAYCSAKSGSHNSGVWNVAESFATTAQLEEVSGTKQYCWCQATGWQPENSNNIYANLNEISWGNQSVDSNAAWVFSYEYVTTNSCMAYCAAHCAKGALNDLFFRRALFVGAGD